MSLSASVRITKRLLNGGFSPRSQPEVYADMELEGKLLALYGKGKKPRIPRETTTQVEVKIEFTKDQQRHGMCEDEDKPYIGYVRLDDRRDPNRTPKEDDDSFPDTVIWAEVNITLPITMFPTLCMWEKEDIMLTTYDDVIERPTKDQDDNYMYAFVTRVGFEIYSDLPEPSTKKMQSLFRKIFIP